VPTPTRPTSARRSRLCALRFDYKIYGLTLGADRRLPHLARERSASELRDVDVRFDSPDGEAPLETVTYGDAAAALQFAISRDGRRLWVDWLGAPPARSVTDATGLLAGPVLGGLLWTKEAIGLHGSVVAIENRAVALLAHRGLGKSTLAAGLAARGHAVLSDDVAAITKGTCGRWWAQPGYPRLRLEPGMITMSRAADAGPVLTGSDKRYVGLSMRASARAWRFGAEPLPLAAVYELRRLPELARPSTAPVSGAERAALLLRHVRPRVLPRDSDAAVRDFSRLGRLASAVPVRRLELPDRLTSVDAACGTLVDDALALAAA